MATGTASVVRERGPNRAPRLFVLPFVVAWVFLAVMALGAEAPIPPSPSHFLTDAVGMLSPSVRDALDVRLENYERQSGHQVVVWIGRTSGDTPIDDFAVRTFKAWRIGRKGLDDGVLMIVLSQDRKIAIQVGYGLEGRVPDVTAGRIIDDVMGPRLKAGDANGALTAGVDALLTAIEGKAVPDSGRGQPAPDAGAPHHMSLGELLLFGVLGIMFLVLLVTHPSLAMYLLFSIMNGGGGYGGGGGGGGGGFSGGGGRSGGGGASGSW